MVYQEFQAVVFAGGHGTRFPEILSDRPKCLLPIGALPLIWYPLNLLEKHGFQDVIVIVIEAHKLDVQQKLEKTQLKLKIDYVTIPNDSDFGTADALRNISEKIKTDVILLSCDVVTDVSLYPLLSQFREHEASISALFFQGGVEYEGIVPGQKMKYKPEKDLVAINANNNRLLFMASTSDFDENIILPGHLLRSNGKINVHSKLIDSHIYVFKKWIIDFLDKSSDFSNIKGELVPHIVKKQMSRPKDISDYEKITTEINDPTKLDDIFEFVPHSEIDEKIFEASIFNEAKATSKSSVDLIKCYAILAPKTAFGIRVNTLHTYCAANQKIFQQWTRLIEPKAIPLVSSANVIKSNQISNCAVADGNTISEKTSVSSSVFGSNCLVNPKTRISNCIIMNSVVIEESVVLENCIVCERATIKSGCVLKNCLIGHNYIVEENSNKEKAYLSNVDGYMEIE